MRSPRQIASSLGLFADLMEFNGENDFKVRAHRVAAEILEGYSGSTAELLAEIRSPGIPKIGDNLGKKILELSEVAESRELAELKKLVPVSVLDLRRVPGLGPKKVRTLWKELGVDSLESLDLALQQGRLSGLKGFGPKVEENIRTGLQLIEKYKGLMRLPRARELFEDQKSRILSIFPEARIAATGELARSCEVVRKVELLLAGVSPENLESIYQGDSDISSIKAESQSLNLYSNRAEHIRMNLAADKDFISRAFEDTGSAEFVSWLKAKNESCLSLPVQDEREIFVRAAVPYIVPERREADNSGIWDHVKADEEQAIVTKADIRGIVHCHSTYSDGSDELRTMAIAARDQGFAYLGIADHSISARYAGGLSADKIKRQHREIDQLNEELAPFRILKGIESDITAEGELDYEDSVLGAFDFIVASVHNGFQMSRQEMTARVVRALRNPYTSILGHPTGRLLLEREPYAIDLEEVIKVAVSEGVIIEINSNPYRLDLDWRMIPFAVECGARFSINPDAHNVRGFSDIAYGVAVSRKAGLRKERVVNAKDPQGFINSLR